MKQTPKEAGYTYLWHEKQTGMYYFLNDATQLIEMFSKNKGFSGWGLKYSGTDLEFCASHDINYKLRFINGLRAITRWGEQHVSFKYAHRLLLKLNAY